VAIRSVELQMLLDRLRRDDPPTFDRYMDELMARIGPYEVLCGVDEALVERLSRGDRT
jgi:hypothetical protein